jgi:phosphoglycolate phosphatase-like HAD superfamily hydrolase
MSSMPALKLAVSNVNPTFTSIAESDPQDIIFDMDGTLADVTHRRHFVEMKPKNWDSFYAGMIVDTPIQPVVMMAQLLKSAGHRIIIATGRPRRYNNITLQFLRDNDILYDAAYLRADKDYRPDTIVKENMLRKMKINGYDPTIAFDDRKSVVEMWRANGLFVFQVDEGNF